MRVRTPVVLQIENAECGAACLAIILAHFRKYVPLEELRVSCGVSRDGSKALNILKASVRYGLIAKGYRGAFDLLKDLPVPYVVFWSLNHFVVVEGLSKRFVYINDPNTGPRKVTIQEFEKSYSGVVLTFKAGDNFQPGGEKPRIERVLLARLRGSVFALFFILAVTLALAVPHTLSALLSRIFIDNVLVQNNSRWIIPIVCFMGLAAALAGAALYLQSLSLLRLETKLAVSASARYMWHLLHLPIEFFSQRSRGDVAGRVHSNDKIAVLLTSDISKHTADLILVVMYALVMYQYDRLLTLISLGILCLDLVVLRVATTKLTASSRRLVKAAGLLNGVSSGAISSIETIKSIGDENDAFVQWHGYQARHAAASQERGRIAQTMGIFPGLFRALGGLAVLTVGGLRVMDGLLSAGMLLALNELMAQCMEPIEKITDLGVSVQEARVSQVRLNDTLRYPVSTTNKSTQVVPEDNFLSGRLSGDVELRNVSFGFNTMDPPVITDISLSAGRGQMVAIVGPSGSGKSTLAKVIAGLYKPLSGEILLDGIPLDRVPQDVITRSITFVDQDIALFQGTIRDNLCMWDASIPMEWIAESSYDACIDEFIAECGGGYDFVLDEDARNLSGGQRQRIEIARSLSNRPSILILDEATSSLDAHVEEMIMHRLRRRGITCLVMAHRLSTVKQCDDVIVLHHGKVVERGTHESMMKGKGPYAKLVASE